MIVHTEHSNHIANQRSWSRRFRTRLLLRLAGLFADGFCCVSEDIAAAIRRNGIITQRRVRVVRNGIDTAAFDAPGDSEPLEPRSGIPLDVPVIGTVARLSEVKRLDLLIRSFATVGTDDRRPHLLVVGDGPESESLRELASSLGLADRVHFAGYRPRPEHFLHLIDVFALTSRLEGMPLAILEAWAAARPVIASRVGGVPEFVTDGETGILFEPGDEAALTQAMSRLLTNPEEARASARRAATMSGPGLICGSWRNPTICFIESCFFARDACPSAD